MGLMDDRGFPRGPEGTAGLPLPKDGLSLPCFHGFASRREVEELLQGRPLGSFLLRLSESQGGIVLSYRGTDRCRHFIIEQMPENRYRILGDQRLHKSIPELLEFYKGSPILPFIEYLTTACNKVPEKHYEDIDRIRRQEMNAREAGGGGITAGDIPNLPEDGAGSTRSPGKLPFDPKATLDARPWAEEGSAKITQEEATYQEVPEKHYEDIDRIRRRKMNAREAGGGGITAGDIRNVPEDGAGSTRSPGTPAFDPKATLDARPRSLEGSAKVKAEEATYQEVPDKHYKDIDRIRRRKMNTREAGGAGITAGDIPNVPEDGAGLTRIPGTPAFDPRTEVPDKHYEDIDRIRRRKMNAREAGRGGITAGDIPNVPEDGAELTRSLGTPPFDPRTEIPDKHYEDIDRIRRRKMNAHEAGGDGITARDIPNVLEDVAGLTRSPGTPAFDAWTEVPDKHYEDIDRIRRRKMNAREADGGGIIAGDIPNVPEDGVGLTRSPGTPPFDPWTEVPDKHYKDIDRIRRRKMNTREAGGAGITAGDIPNVPEDGAGLTRIPGTPAFDPRTEVPDKHYEDIDRIRRRKMNAREAGRGGITAGDIPNVPEDGAELTRSLGTPPFDPRTEIPDKHYEDIDRIRRRKMNAHEAGGDGITARDIPNVLEDVAGLTRSPGTPAFDAWTEVPDKHYEDIDRIRRRKMNAREADGGGIIAGDIPNVPEDGVGLTRSPGTPPFDPWTEVPDKHYEDIDRIRRRKMNAREAGGAGITAGDIPNVPEDGAGLTRSLGTPPFDPRTEVPDKHYEDIDRIRRRKMNAREADGGGIIAGDIPNVPEDGVGLTRSPGTPPFDPWTEVPDKHYEDIDRIRRRKMNAREAGGAGITAGDIPNVPEDGAGLTRSLGTPPFDPRTEVPDKHYEDIDRIRRRKMNAHEAGGDGITARDIPNVPEDGVGLTRSPGTPAFDPWTEIPDKHYEDIDRIRRRKMNAREADGGGIIAGDIPNVPEDGAGSIQSPGTPPFDLKARLDSHPWSMEGSAKVTAEEATYQEIPEGRTLVRNASNKDLNSRPTEPVMYTKTHIYTQPGPRACGSVDRTHTYAEPTQTPLYADPNDKIVLYAGPQGLLPSALGRQRHHVYSELDPKIAGRGNLYCPAPTKTPDLPPRQPADNPREEVMPSAPPRWPSPPLAPLGIQPTYAQPTRWGPPASRGPAADGFELDNPDYGVFPRLAARPGPETRPSQETKPSQKTKPVLTPRPGPETRLVPEMRPRKEMRPLPQPRPDLAPRPCSEMRPVPEVKPETELRACPEMRPSQETRPISETMPVPVPRPGAEMRPVLMPKTVAEPRPILMPRPDPTPKPVPRPDPTPRSVPRPDPTPRPVPRPDPTPRPVPRPDPTPRPVPRPDPTPRPVPRPDPTPKPVPRPDPTLKPVPRPDLEARPAPTPRPNHTTPVPALIQPENLYERLPEEYLRPPPFAPSRPIYRRDS